MGTSRDEFVKYPRTPHLFGSKGTDDDKHLGESASDRFLADPSLIVEEKLDGTNVGLHFTHAGQMVLQCRGHLVTEGMHPQYDLFKQWAAVKRTALEDRLGSDHILFGEWLYAKHSVHYRRLPHYFFEFDIYDKRSAAFVSLEVRLSILEGTGIHTVPVIHKGPLTKKQLERLIGPSRYDARFENPLTGQIDDLIEGLYLRTENDGAVTGRAKYVRPEFVEKVKQSTHWQYQTLLPNLLDPRRRHLVMNWHELSQSSIEDVIAWAEAQPWAQAMADCQQDAGWHAEGDVWTHTKMVCRQLPLLAEWQSLTRQEQTILIFTALFHDSAKPLTSLIDPESGRIRSPKHSVKGEHLARCILRELGCDLATREEIAWLVRFHGRPAYLLEKAHPENEVISLSWLVSNRLLYLFALADTRGWQTKETSRAEENLHLWKLTAEENGCFETPFPFANDQARFLFFRSEKPDRFYVPHEDYRCTVTLMSGLPGSGKDTWLATNQPSLPVISLDDLRAELEIEATENQGEVAQLAQERCRERLRAGEDFAFSATNLTRQTRKRWIDLFANYGARIETVYVEPPLRTILDRNRRREQKVPDEVILRLASKIEPPTLTEAHGGFTASGRD